MQFRSILMPSVMKMERIGDAYARDANVRRNEGSAVFIGQTQ